MKNLRSKSTTKEVSVVARIEFKNDPRKVVYRCLSSNGTDQYNVFFFDGMYASCDCPARVHSCKHSVACQERETARSDKSYTQARAERETRDAMSRYQLGYYSE